MSKARSAGFPGRLRSRLDELYHGNSKAGLRFRLVLLTFDLVIIGTYVVTSMFGLPKGYPALDLLLAGDPAGRSLGTLADITERA